MIDENTWKEIVRNLSLIDHSRKNNQAQQSNRVMQSERNSEAIGSVHVILFGRPLVMHARFQWHTRDFPGALPAYACMSFRQGLQAVAAGEQHRAVHKAAAGARPMGFPRSETGPWKHARHA